MSGVKPVSRSHSALPERAGAKGEGFFEAQGKMNRAGEADFLGDSGNRASGELEKLGGAGQTLVLQKLSRRDPNFVLEAMREP